MLQRNPRSLARHGGLRLASWWQRGPSRLRLRRRLIAYSLPVALLLVTGMVMIVSEMLAGHAAISDFARRDVDGLRADVSALRALNIDPGRVSFVAGDLAALEGNLDAADERFTAALTRGADPCAVRINLELVRESQGDLAAAGADTTRARQRYDGALQSIFGAPPRCFQDNTDPDPDRRRIRNDAAARVSAKIDALSRLAPPARANPIPSMSAPAPPPPPPPPAPPFGSRRAGLDGGPGALNDISPDRIPVSDGESQGSLPGHRLGTGDGGSPLDRLQDALADADSTGASGHAAVTGPHS